jgi:hypothetical protein
MIPAGVVNLLKTMAAKGREVGGPPALVFYAASAAQWSHTQRGEPIIKTVFDK